MVLIGQVNSMIIWCYIVAHIWCTHDDVMNYWAQFWLLHSPVLVKGNRPHHHEHLVWVSDPPRGCSSATDTVLVLKFWMALPIQNFIYKYFLCSWCYRLVQQLFYTLSLSTQSLIPSLPDKTDKDETSNNCFTVIRSSVELKTIFASLGDFDINIK